MPSHRSNPLVQMIDEIIRLNSRLRTVFAGSAEATGLSAMEAAVLAAVVDAQRAPTVARIGRSLGHPRQIIQRAANNLIEAELVRTMPNPDHKRAVLLYATEAGKKRKRVADAHALKLASHVLKNMNAQKCARLARELHTLRTEIEDQLRARRAKTG